MLYFLMTDTAESNSSDGTYIGIHELAVCQAITSLCMCTIDDLSCYVILPKSLFTGRGAREPDHRHVG